MGKEQGRDCYIVCGSNICYDPELESAEVKRRLRRVGIDDNQSSVSALIAVGGRGSLQKLPKHQSGVTL